MNKTTGARVATEEEVAIAHDLILHGRVVATHETVCYFGSGGDGNEWRSGFQASLVPPSQVGDRRGMLALGGQYETKEQALLVGLLIQRAYRSALLTAP